jgi:hypothetical protein
MLPTRTGRCPEITMPKKKRKKSKQKNRRRQRRNSSAGTEMQPSGYEGPGFDYGVLPRIMVIGDLDFLTLWKKAACVAMCYTIVPQVGVRSNVPVAAMGFNNYQAAKKLFERFKSWMKPPCDETALTTAFISAPEDGDYFLLVGTNPQQLVRRVLGEGAENDYFPLTVGRFLVKKFQLSAHFETFRRLVTGKEILICPTRAPREIQGPDMSSVTLAIDPEDMGLQDGFFKRDVSFLDKALLAPDTIEYRVTEIPSTDKPTFDSESSPPPPTPEEVTHLRKRQMKRFFPVTIARLPYNQSFKIARENLLSKYAEWQIIQAACNLYARGNWPQLGTGEKVNMQAIYENMRNHVQSSMEAAPLSFAYEVRQIEDQIASDIAYLHSYVCTGLSRDAQADLRSRGYL